jgi:hypothetical protein
MQTHAVFMSLSPWLLLGIRVIAVAAFAIANRVAAVCPLLASAIVMGAAAPRIHRDFAANISK